MKKMIINFDLDGTLYDLYGKINWLEDCRTGAKGTFTDGNDLVDMVEFVKACKALQRKGNEVNVITWTPNTNDKNALLEAELQKIKWITKKMNCFNRIRLMNYGVTKTMYMVKDATNILFDDNEGNRNEWIAKGGIAYDEKNIIETLRGLL
jgi:hypothetical protein